MYVNQKHNCGQHCGTPLVPPVHLDIQSLISVLIVCLLDPVFIHFKMFLPSPSILCVCLGMCVRL